jgi:NhaP-type Na+/H+ or K+/H+ antiporter
LKLNANLPNDGVLAMTMVCTVILSIVFHGLSANPWAKGFGERSRED